MKRLILSMLLLVAMAGMVQAQITQTFNTPLKLNNVEDGTSEDSLLVKGADNIVRKISAEDISGGVVTETDPTVPQHVKDITTTNIGNWNTAFGWGNHANAGYLTSFTETDPTVPQHVKNITTTNIGNWNTAYGWGNHANAGYLTSYTETDPVFTTSPAGGITSTDINNWNASWNRALVGASFNSSNGIITLNRNDITDLTFTIDGRYSLLSHNHSLNSLSNVTITSNTSGELLSWNGSAWVNRTLAELGVASTGNLGSYAQLGSTTANDDYLMINRNSSGPSVRINQYGTGDIAHFINGTSVGDTSGASVVSKITNSGTYQVKNGQNLIQNQSGTSVLYQGSGGGTIISSDNADISLGVNGLAGAGRATLSTDGSFSVPNSIQFSATNNLPDANDFLTEIPQSRSIGLFSHTSGSSNYPTGLGQTLFVRGATNNRSFAIDKDHTNNNIFNLGNWNDGTSSWEWSEIWHSNNLTNPVQSGDNISELNNDAGYAQLGSITANDNYLYLNRNNGGATLYVNHYGSGDIARFYGNGSSQGQTGSNVAEIANNGEFRVTTFDSSNRGFARVFNYTGGGWARRLAVLENSGMAGNPFSIYTYGNGTDYHYTSFGHNSYSSNPLRIYLDGRVMAINQPTTIGGHGVVTGSRSVDTGLHLSGGGDLTTDRTLTLTPTVNQWVKDSEGNGRMYFGAVGASNAGILRASDTGQFFSFRSSTNNIVTRIDADTGELIANGHIETRGDGGSVALTTNDGMGNANVTFNHKNGKPDKNGNAARIEVNVDSSTGAQMDFEVRSGVSSGVSTSLANIFSLSENGAKLYTGHLTLANQASSTTHAVRADRTINSGSGLTGGGNLTANRTISLNSASQASLELANTALQSGDNISELNNNAGYTSNLGTVTSVSGGGGLTGNVTSSGSISMGTPTKTTFGLGNTVTSTSHRHAIDQHSSRRVYSISSGSTTVAEDIRGIEDVYVFEAGNTYEIMLPKAEKNLNLKITIVRMSPESKIGVTTYSEDVIQKPFAGSVNSFDLNQDENAKVNSITFIAERNRWIPLTINTNVLE